MSIALEWDSFLGIQGAKRVGIPRMEGWLLPPTGQFKLNADGDFNHGSKAGMMGATSD